MLLEKSVVGERHVPTVADHDVVEEVDAEEVAGLFQAFGDLLVLGRWCRIAARVVVNRNDRGGVRYDRRLINLPRLCCGPAYVIWLQSHA